MMNTGRAVPRAAEALSKMLGWPRLWPVRQACLSSMVVGYTTRVGQISMLLAVASIVCLQYPWYSIITCVSYVPYHQH